MAAAGGADGAGGPGPQEEACQAFIEGVLDRPENDGICSVGDIVEGWMNRGHELVPTVLLLARLSNSEGAPFRYMGREPAAFSYIVRVGDVERFATLPVNPWVAMPLFVGEAVVGQAAVGQAVVEHGPWSDDAYDGDSDSCQVCGDSLDTHKTHSLVLPLCDGCLAEEENYGDYVSCRVCGESLDTHTTHSLPYPLCDVCMEEFII